MKRNCLIGLFWAVIAACFACDPVVGGCNNIDGPGGDVDCVRISGYSGYQLAKCRSDTNIKRISGNKHSCGPFGVFRYCSYQCMLDLYEETSGEIYEKCRCNPYTFGSHSYPSSGGIKPRSPGPITPFTVFSLCYTHNATNCRWYQLCLNQAFPSCDLHNEDTIKFLTEFCILTKENLTVLSAPGKQWLDDTGKCVKGKLATLLATGKQVKNCKYIRTTAMERYSQCYREPSSRFCDISEEDRLGLFWHLVHNTSHHNTYENGLKIILDLMRECRNDTKDDVLVQKVKAKLEKKERGADIVPTVSKELQIAEVRIKAWLENPPVTPIQVDIVLTKNSWWSVSSSGLEKQSSFAAKIIEKLASKQKWKDKSVAWFAFAMKKGEDLNVRLLLDNRHRFNSTSSGRADLGAILVKLSDALLKGSMKFKVEFHRDVEIIKLAGCLNSSCQEHAFRVGYGSPDKSCITIKTDKNEMFY